MNLDSGFLLVTGGSPFLGAFLGAFLLRQSGPSARAHRFWAGLIFVCPLNGAHPILVPVLHGGRRPKRSLLQRLGLLRVSFWRPCPNIDEANDATPKSTQIGVVAVWLFDKVWPNARSASRPFAMG
jgi:hypothetical protein